MRLSLVKQAAIPLILGIGVPLLLMPIATSGFHPEANRTGMLPVLISVVGIPLLVGYFGLRNVKSLICFNLIIAASAIFLSTASAYRPDSLIQLGCMLLGFYVLAIIIINVIGIFQLESFIPVGISLLCVILIILANKIGHRARLYVFQQRLPQYEEAVRVMESKIVDKPVFLQGDSVPEEYRHLAYWIHAEINEQNVLVVTFFWGGGFPAKHTAFAYISDGRIPEKDPDFKRECPYVSRINENWFKVAD
ncbi:MAG: hypothetical protein ACYS4W_09250 [Planctomycetota bacterium]